MKQLSILALLVALTYSALAQRIDHIVHFTKDSFAVDGMNDQHFANWIS
ncbi:MAG: hypothetical protein SH856_08095 [Flavobacteriales bacterium]|mgnify:CR=1 FL=1|nr:hypothetical protein [Flavobacteriales bacterium]